eukprot:gene20234-22211_t
MSTNGPRIEQLAVVERSSCTCTCMKKERTFTLTVLGALQFVIALGSLAVGNWAVFSFSQHLRKTAAFPFWSGGAILVCGFLNMRSWRHVNKLWITTTATLNLLTTVLYVSCSCWMIDMLINETSKDKSIKTYVFYGYNMTASITGFLLAGLSTGVAWSIRDTLPQRRRECTSTNRVGPSNMVSFSVEEYHRSVTELGPPPPYEP